MNIEISDNLIAKMVADACADAIRHNSLHANICRAVSAIVEQLDIAALVEREIERRVNHVLADVVVDVLRRKARQEVKKQLGSLDPRDNALHSKLAFLKNEGIKAMAPEVE